MSAKALDLSRDRILAYRRRAQALDERLPAGRDSIRRAAWAGLQDSMPRAALLSIHARVEGTTPSTWEDRSLVQLWGPRFSTYVVAARDRAIFSLGRLPADGAGRRRADELAERLRSALDGAKVPHRQAGRMAGVSHPNLLRYAAPTGTVLIRWDGARDPIVWTATRPRIHPVRARLELARRYLRVFGPSTPASFARWAGISPADGHASFEELSGALVPVRTPIGEASLLAEDEPAVRAPGGPLAPARLLPSGDTYFLLHGAERELLVPNASHRGVLWTSRVWPGALLVGGDVVGTWRRADRTLTVASWRRLSREERRAVEDEAATLPLPGTTAISVRWANA